MMSWEDNPGLGCKVSLEGHQMSCSALPVEMMPWAEVSSGSALPLFAATLGLLVDDCILRKNCSGFQVSSCRLEKVRSVR